jgi:hypothetical protein
VSATVASNACILVEESPDVSFYVFAEPALSAPEPEDWNVWQEAGHLRTENLYWRECITAIAQELDHYQLPADAVRRLIEQHVTELGRKIGTLYRTQREQR